MAEYDLVKSGIIPLWDTSLYRCCYKCDREKVLPSRLDAAGVNTKGVMDYLNSGKAKVVKVPVSELVNMMSLESILSKKDAT